jgi:hypothetical protein
MSQYDDPMMIKMLGAYWNENGESAWDEYKINTFCQKSFHDRVHELKNVDSWLENETKLTHEHAALVSKRRELVDLHFALKKIGR